MIAGLSKFAILYISPLLALAAVILSFIAFLSPITLLHDQVALITITPSTSLIQTGSSQDVDGPSVFLGLLGVYHHLKGKKT